MTESRIRSFGVTGLAVFFTVLDAAVLKAGYRSPGKSIQKALPQRVWLRVVSCVEGSLGLFFAVGLFDFWDPPIRHELMWRLVAAMVSVAFFRKCWLRRRALALLDRTE
jgi:hypothetical protein